MMKRIVAMFMVVMCFAALTTGCNTWRGAGKDVEKAGEGMQKQ